jgi:hypothetical protein
VVFRHLGSESSALVTGHGSTVAGPTRSGQRRSHACGQPILSRSITAGLPICGEPNIELLTWQPSSGKRPLSH